MTFLNDVLYMLYVSRAAVTLFCTQLEPCLMVGLKDCTHLALYVVVTSLMLWKQLSNSFVSVIQAVLVMTNETCN